MQSKSVEPLHRAHGGLDVQGPHVLPVLLQQRDEEVHGKMNILDKVILSHTHVANSNGQAEHLKKDIKDRNHFKAINWPLIVTIFRKR